MREAEIMAKLNAQDRKIDHLQQALNAAEQKVFGMWAVMNTVMHLLQEKEVYTEAEYKAKGLLLAAERERLIQQRAQQIKDKEELTPFKPELLQSKIDTIKPN